MKKIKNRKALLAIIALLLITVVGTTLAFFIVVVHLQMAGLVCGYDNPDCS